MKKLCFLLQLNLLFDHAQGPELHRGAGHPASFNVQDATRSAQAPDSEIVFPLDIRVAMFPKDLPTPSTQRYPLPHGVREALFHGLGGGIWEQSHSCLKISW